MIKNIDLSVFNPYLDKSKRFNKLTNIFCILTVVALFAFVLAMVFDKWILVIVFVSLCLIFGGFVDYFNTKSRKQMAEVQKLMTQMQLNLAVRSYKLSNPDTDPSSNTPKP